MGLPASPADVLRLLHGLGLEELPAPHHSTLVDPKLLAWLLEPQLLHVRCCAGLLWRQQGWLGQAAALPAALPAACYACITP